jgi:hypothetical protein
MLNDSIQPAYVCFSQRYLRLRRFSVMAALTISSQVLASHAAYEGLLKCLRDSTERHSGLLDGLSYQFDRFKMWIGNIGAHKQGQNSLDFRLRDASHIRKTINDMLASLLSVLLDGQSHVSHQTVRSLIILCCTDSYAKQPNSYSTLMKLMMHMTSWRKTSKAFSRCPFPKCCRVSSTS